MTQLLGIKTASQFLGVSMDTLRRWDKSGKITAIRKNHSGHRYYQLFDLENLLTTNCIDTAKKWAQIIPGQKPNDLFYCPDSSVFQSRLYKFRAMLDRSEKLDPLFSLLIAMVGEIGDNSFGHNLGNWQDVVGIFFGYDLKAKKIVLADRGQGVLKTLKRVKPTLQNDQEALQTAFTEIISGRAPENRGNGLKYVVQIISQNPIGLFFQSGQAQLTIEQHRSTLNIKLAPQRIPGCLAIISF